MRSAGISSVAGFPMASSAVYPKRRWAPLLKVWMMPCRSLLMIASPEDDTIAARCAAAASAFCACSVSSCCRTEDTSSCSFMSRNCRSSALPSVVGVLFFIGVISISLGAQWRSVPELENPGTGNAAG